MTAVRILLVFFLLLTILFFPFRMLQFIALLYLLLLGLSFGYSHLVARHVTVRRLHLVQRAQRFEAVEITLLVENRGSLPIHYLSVVDRQNHFFLSDMGKFLIGLGPGENKRLSYTIKSQDRGEYLIGPALVEGSDPLGFFPWRKKQRAVQRLLVYPEVLPLNLDHRTGLPAGNIRVNNRIYEDVTRYRSVREYVPGDALKRVNWKVSARLGKLYSMDYLPLLHAPVLILLNLTKEDYPLRYRHHRVERATTVAASLVNHFLSLRQDMGFITSGSFKARAGGSADRGPADGSSVGEGPEAGIPAAEIRGTPGHAMTIMEMLARIDISREEADITQLLRRSGIDIPPQTRLEVITPLLKEEQRAFFRTVKEKGCQVEIFLVGSDTWREKEWRAKNLLAREFSVFSVKDYGRELVHD